MWNRSEYGVAVSSSSGMPNCRRIARSGNITQRFRYQRVQREDYLVLSQLRRCQEHLTSTSWCQSSHLRIKIISLPDLWRWKLISWIPVCAASNRHQANGILIVQISVVVLRLASRRWRACYIGDCFVILAKCTGRDTIGQAFFATEKYLNPQFIMILAASLAVSHGGMNIVTATTRGSGKTINCARQSEFAW